LAEVVPNEELPVPHPLHEVEEEAALPCDEDHVVGSYVTRVDRGEGDELPALDPPAHRSADGAELHAPPLRELLPRVVHPAHEDTLCRSRTGQSVGGRGSGQPVITPGEVTDAGSQ